MVRATSVSVQFIQNLTQTGNRRSRLWFPRGGQRGWRQPATASCLGQKGIGQDRTSGLSGRTDFNNHPATVCYQYRFATRGRVKPDALPGERYVRAQPRRLRDSLAGLCALVHNTCDGA